MKVSEYIFYWNLSTCLLILTAYRVKTNSYGQEKVNGWGLLKFINFAVKAFFILQKCLLGYITHFHSWRLSPHLRYNESGRFWTWHSMGNWCFDECNTRENNGTGGIGCLRPREDWKMPYPFINQMIFNWSEYEFCISISILGNTFSTVDVNRYSQNAKYILKGDVAYLTSKCFSQIEDSYRSYYPQQGNYMPLSWHNHPDITYAVR